VSAKDVRTGKLRALDVTDSTALPADEVDRLLGDARSNATDDRARRGTIELRNRLEGLAHHVARALESGGASAAPADRASAEALLAEAREGLEGRRLPDELKALARELDAVAQRLALAAADAPAGHIPSA
jgi:molecular chaperone DnaK